MSDSAKTQIKKINQLYKQQDELYHNFAVRCRVSDTALWVLYSICSSEQPFTQYDLANTWFFPKQTVNSAITGLEKEGMIALVPLPGTRNRKNVLLTEAGRSFCERTVIPLLEAEERTYLQFSDDERQTFFALMEKQFRLLREALDGIAEK